MSSTVQSLLSEARELLLVKGWCQGGFAQNARGVSEPIHSPDAAKFCSVGAVFKVAPNSDLAGECLIKLVSQISGQVLAVWNDDYSRTREEVIELFDKAIQND